MRHWWRVAPKHLHKNENPALLSYISVATPMYTSQSDVFSINTALTHTHTYVMGSYMCARARPLLRKASAKYFPTLADKSEAQGSLLTLTSINSFILTRRSANNITHSHRPLVHLFIIIIFISWRVVCNGG